MVGYDSDELIAKAGGRYRFVSLVQRRMRELQRGMPPLVEQRASLLATAIEELRQEKIWLVSGEEAERLEEERVDDLPETPAAPEALAPPAQ